MTLLQSAYIHVINLSIAASFLMLAVILLRRKKAEAMASDAAETAETGADAPENE